MKKLILSIIICFCLCSTSYASCFVMNQTIFAHKKDNIYRLSDALNSGKRDKVEELVNRGLVGMCTQASCVVLENDGTLAHVRILGIGTVWTFSNFVVCD